MTNRNNPEQTALPLLVTAAVIFEEDKVLITRRPDDGVHPGLWEFPGGKIEAGESPEQALCREIREELAADIAVTGIFEVVYYRYDWGPVLILVYRCQLLSSVLHNIGVAEHRWVSPRELGDFAILAADQPIVDRLKSSPSYDHR